MYICRQKIGEICSVPFQLSEPYKPENKTYLSPKTAEDQRHTKRIGPQGQGWLENTQGWIHWYEMVYKILHSCEYIWNNKGPLEVSILVTMVPLGQNGLMYMPPGSSTLPVMQSGFFAYCVMNQGNRGQAISHSFVRHQRLTGLKMLSKPDDRYMM